MKAQLSATIIILIYKTYGKTINCLNSIIPIENGINIIIVDNERPNSEFFNLKNKYSNYPYMHFISTGANLGYAKGNNFGINWASENNLLNEYIVIVNNDIEFRDSSIFSGLIKNYQDLDQVGVVSPKIIHKRTGVIQGPYKKESVLINLIEALFPFIIPLRIKKEQKWRNSLTTPTKVYRTMGSFMLIKSELFAKINWFDQRTFLGSEEEILAEKLILLNKCFYLDPTYSVLHDHGSSTSLLNSRESEGFFMDSQLYYFKNYRGVNSISLFILKNACRLKNFWRRLLK